MGACEANESPVACVGPLGPFLLYTLSSLYPEVNLIMSVSAPAWREVQGAGGQDTDILLETRLPMRVEAGRILEVFQR